MLDFPVKERMFQMNLLLEADGQVVRLDEEGVAGLLDLPRVARELYRTARVLRLYTFERRRVEPEWLLDRVAEPTFQGRALAHETDTR